MPGPIRRPPNRPPTMIITDAAVTLYERAKKLIASGKEDAPELRDISYQLGAELKMRPWATDVLDTLGYSKPPEWEPDGDDWWRSAGLRDQLEQVLRERRKARREPNGAPDQPPG